MCLSHHPAVFASALKNKVQRKPDDLGNFLGTCEANAVSALLKSAKRGQGDSGFNGNAFLCKV
jgi:hypothetical protein